MVSARRCALCEGRSGRRPCPALKAPICTRCCGQSRGRKIDCPQCAYRDNVSNVQRRASLDELAEPLHAVRPDVLGCDLLDDGPTATFARHLEQIFGWNYLNAAIKDADVLEALRAGCFVVYRNREYPTSSAFAHSFVKSLREQIRPRFGPLIPPDLQEQVLLRLMWSVKNISGGCFGDCGYLNYVKNNVLNDPLPGRYVAEFADGTRISNPIPGGLVGNHGRYET